jgi:hypothetical protein
MHRVALDRTHAHAPTSPLALPTTTQPHITTAPLAFIPHATSHPTARTSWQDGHDASDVKNSEQQRHGAPSSSAGRLEHRGHHTTVGPAACWARFHRHAHTITLATHTPPGNICACATGRNPASTALVHTFTRTRARVAGHPPLPPTNHPQGELELTAWSQAEKVGTSRLNQSCKLFTTKNKNRTNTFGPRASLRCGRAFGHSRGAGLGGCVHGAGHTMEASRKAKVTHFHIGVMLLQSNSFPACALSHV